MAWFWSSPYLIFIFRIPQNSELVNQSIACKFVTLFKILFKKHK